MNGAAVNPFSPPADGADKPANGTDFIVTADDFVAAYWLHIRPRPWILGLWIAVGVLVVTGLAVAVFNSPRAYVWVLFLAIWLLSFTILGPRRMGKLYTQMPWMSLDQSIRLDGERLVLHNDWVTARIPIEAIKRIKRNRKLALIYVGAPTFYVIKSEAPRIAALIDEVESRR